MARLRFPGRPGFRFDRLGVRYGLEEHRRGLDQSTKLIQNVHSGLRYFRELFGESDEVSYALVSCDSFAPLPQFRSLFRIDSFHEWYFVLQIAIVSSVFSKTDLKQSHLCQP